MNTNPLRVPDTLHPSRARNTPPIEFADAPLCCAYLDAPNIQGAGAAVSAARRGLAPNAKFASEHRIFDPTFRTNFAWLRRFAVGEDCEGNARTILVGSNKAGSDGAVYRAAERARWTTITSRRSTSGAEKEVDTGLSVVLLEDLLCHPARPDDVDVTLLCGDRDQLPAIRALKRRGYVVDIIAWEHATSPELRREARRFIALDDYFDLVGFHEARA